MHLNTHINISNIYIYSLILKSLFCIEINIYIGIGGLFDGVSSNNCTYKNI